MSISGPSSAPSGQAGVPPCSRYTYFVISHTHWDREWYQPFQEFRVRLVRLVDRLLDLLAAGPDFRYFMLDGQAVVLKDYNEFLQEQQRVLNHRGRFRLYTRSAQQSDSQLKQFVRRWKALPAASGP